MSDQNKIILAPCSLNTTLSCFDAVTILKDAFLTVDDSYSYCEIPLSAGGVGTMDVIEQHCKGRRHTTPALCGDDRRRSIDYYLTNDSVAVIEAAALLGSPLCDFRSPGGITSYGVGSVAVDAIKNGAKRLFFILGDTCNIDGGCGVARALGALFLTNRGKPFTPTGTTLDEICYIDRDKLLSVDAVCLCDTNDLLLGDVGTVGRYAREVGRYPEQMPRLMSNLRYLHDLIQPEIISEEGDGAGGGIAYMLRTMFGAKLCSGADFMMKLSDYAACASNAKLIITAIPHLDTRMQTHNYFQALRKYAEETPIAAISIDSSPDFSPERYGLRAVVTLNEYAKKTPHDAVTLKTALFDAGMQLAKSLL